MSNHLTGYQSPLPLPALPKLENEDLTPRVAYVESTGNDSTALVGRRDRPYRTAQAAYNALVALGGDTRLLHLGIGSFEIFTNGSWPAGIHVGGVSHASILSVTALGGGSFNLGSALSLSYSGGSVFVNGNGFGKVDINISGSDSYIFNEDTENPMEVPATNARNGYVYAVQSLNVTALGGYDAYGIGTGAGIDGEIRIYASNNVTAYGGSIFIYGGTYVSLLGTQSLLNTGSISI